MHILQTTLSPRLRRLYFLALTAGALSLPLVPSANAGSYDVWTCRTPDDAAADTRDADGGWNSSFFGTSPEGGNLIVDDCADGGALRLALAMSAPQPAPSFLVWTFTAPPHTSIGPYELDIDGYSRPMTGTDSYGDITVSTNRQQDPIYDARFPGFGAVPRQLVVKDAGDSALVRVQVSCAPYGQTTCGPGPDGSASRVSLYRGTFTLLDRDAPAVSSVSGSATTDDLWAGATGISVGATDQGGGVYRLGVEVDGEVRSWLNLAGAPCVAWPGTARTFLSPKPCPSSVGGVQRISTADLPDGVHTVRVLVEDAAGNQTTAYGPVTKTLRRTADGTPVKGGDGSTGGSASDPGPLNGTPASAEARIRARWTGREGATRSIRFNQRPKLDGQLTTPSGQPISDAYVRVTITRDARNSPAFARDSLRTDKNGRFRWTLPTGISSRSIRFTYHQRVNDTKPVASTSLKLRVTAAVRLALSRKVARRGQTVKLAGTVVGRPVPGGGKLVELQARNPGKRWITFRTVRTKKSGKFAASYRFRNGGPATFQMRARARKSGDYPYATGASPVRTIKVR